MLPRPADLEASGLTFFSLGEIGDGARFLEGRQVDLLDIFTFVEGEN
jgi:hypothetical protein